MSNHLLLPVEGTSHICGFYCKDVMPIDAKEDFLVEGLVHEYPYIKTCDIADNNALEDDEASSELDPARICEEREELSYKKTPVLFDDTMVNGQPLVIYLMQNKITNDVPCMAGRATIDQYAEYLDFILENSGVIADCKPVAPPTVDDTHHKTKERMRAQVNHNNDRKYVRRNIINTFRPDKSPKKYNRQDNPFKKDHFGERCATC